MSTFFVVLFSMAIGYCVGFACKGLLSDRPNPDADESEHGVG